MFVQPLISKKKRIQSEKDCNKKPFRLERFQIEDKVILKTFLR